LIVSSAMLFEIATPKDFYQVLPSPSTGTQAERKVRR
jgi:hypothetical protein